MTETLTGVVYLNRIIIIILPLIDDPYLQLHARCTSLDSLNSPFIPRFSGAECSDYDLPFTSHHSLFIKSRFPSHDCRVPIPGSRVTIYYQQAPSTIMQCRSAHAQFEPTQLNQPISPSTSPSVYVHLSEAGSYGDAVAVAVAGEGEVEVKGKGYLSTHPNPFRSNSAAMVAAWEYSCVMSQPPPLGEGRGGDVVKIKMKEGET